MAGVKPKGAEVREVCTVRLEPSVAEKIKYDFGSFTFAVEVLIYHYYFKCVDAKKELRDIVALRKRMNKK